MNDESNLPRWARTELEALRQRLRDAEDRYASNIDNSPSVVVHDPYSKFPRNLDSDQEVRFMVDGVGNARVFIDVSLDGHHLVVKGSHPVLIEPLVTNHLRVSIKDLARR